MPENLGIDQPKLPVRIYVKGQHQYKGYVHGKTYHKRVHSSRHFLRDFEAIGISAACLREAERLGATEFEVLDLDKNKMYRTAFATMREHGFVRDFGHGEQLFLNFRWWSIDGNPPAAFAAVPEPPKPQSPAAPASVQPTLMDWINGAVGND